MKSDMTFDYEVLVTPDAEVSLAECIAYLVEKKKSLQAAKNVLSDYDETIKRLSTIAGSIKLCESEKLAARELRRINFKEHRYFLLYFLDENRVIVTNMFHELEDYEGKIK